MRQLIIHVQLVLLLKFPYELYSSSDLIIKMCVVLTNFTLIITIRSSQIVLTDVYEEVGQAGLEPATNGL